MFRRTSPTFPLGILHPPPPQGETIPLFSYWLEHVTRLSLRGSANPVSFPITLHLDWKSGPFSVMFTPYILQTSLLKYIHVLCFHQVTWGFLGNVWLVRNETKSGLDRECTEQERSELQKNKTHGWGRMEKLWYGIRGESCAGLYWKKQPGSRIFFSNTFFGNVVFGFPLTCHKKRTYSPVDSINWNFFTCE